ncbi:MAG: hypothetical protein ACOZAA_07520, partial [Pseudomonadota bacterium]
RATPARPWRALAVASLAALALSTAAWEGFWRTKGYAAGDFKNSEGLWAEQRRKATGDATVLIGSSRILFDIDLDIWEEVSGVRPVQLALEGTSPRIFLKNLADDPSFHGQVIVGVTAPLFFTTDGGLRAGVLDYVRDETLSERADHFLSMRLEQVFAFLDEQTRPKRQIEIWPLPLRDGMTPLFSPRKLEAMGADRNAQLWRRVETDERYRNEATGQWLLALKVFAPPPGPDGKPAAMPDEAINAIIAEVKANIEKIRARGGDVAFLRLPYGGAFTPAEDNGFPRARFWDRLIRETNAVGVTWHDYPALQGFTLPEWSHLSASEAERYTRAVAPIFYDEVNKKAD